MPNSSENMKAVAFQKNLPIDDRDSLLDVELPIPEPGPRDLLVKVEAVSVNPVDVKVRTKRDPGGLDRVLGFDAAGRVIAAGEEVTLFSPGDEVFYAGSIDRPGTNSQFHVVDERITGRKPTSLDFAQAAALPLTAITAWESLFDRFRVGPDDQGTLLVLGGAGGVGSILIQLARKLTPLTVVASASREESADWARQMGADHIVNHQEDLVGQIEALAPGGLSHIFSPYSDGMIETFAAILAPGGQVVAIDEPNPTDVVPLRSKSITWHWELMFTRPMFQADDMIEQHRLLNEVAKMVDAGELVTTLRQTLGPISAETLKEAHRIVESNHSVGKVVVAGWD